MCNPCRVVLFVPEVYFFRACRGAVVLAGMIQLICAGALEYRLFAVYSANWLGRRRIRRGCRVVGGTPLDGCDNFLDTHGHDPLGQPFFRQAGLRYASSGMPANSLMQYLLFSARINALAQRR
jgi:hypothetical protein